MNASPLLLAIGLITGAAFASQGAVNGRLSAHVGGPLMAALISFTVGWLALVAVNLVTRQPVPVLSTFSAVPWWAYLGGFIGAFGVASAAFAVPQMGVATWVACIIAGQLICALVLDKYGAFGQAVREITPGRLLGALLLAGGVYCMRRF